MPDHVADTAALAVLQPDGVICYCSPAFARLFGAKERRAVAGTHVDSWLLPENRQGPGWFAAARSLADHRDDQPDGHAAGRAGRIGGQAMRADGGGPLGYRLDPMPDGGAVLYLDGAGGLDMVRARAFHINPGLSAISVLETGEHLDVNAAWLRNMEYRREEVIGRTASEMRIWELGDASRAEIVRRLRRDGKIENFQTRLRTRTGKLRDILVSAELVRVPDRSLAFFASTDITEVKKAQEELEALNRQLERRIAARTAEIERKGRELARAAERAQAANEAKSHFLSVMSHEIRTPLNALLNLAELLVEDGGRQPAAAHLAGIASSARALAAIVEDVLDFSRIETGHLEIHPAPTDLGPLCEETLRSLAPQAHAKGLDLVLAFGRRLPANAVLDPVRLRQILFNLVGNAIKYTKKGWIEVRADLAADPGPDSDPGGGLGPQLFVEVADTGIGIRPDDQDRIFDRFSRLGAEANREIHGAGLGLNISAGLVRAMGGTIGVESRPGRGSTFRVTLPLAACGGPSLDPPAPAAPGREPPRRVILLGPATRTRAAFESVLRGQGMDLRMFDSAADLPETALDGADAALIVLPVAPDTVDSLPEWQAAVRGLGDRAVLFVPLGHAAARIAAAGAGLRVEDYPIAPARLLALLQGPAGGVDPGSGPGSDPGRAVSLAGMRILVADDGEENRLVAQWVLSAAGAEVVTADSGRAAVDCAMRQCFDILLLDLRMPGLDGHETAARIRRLGGWAADVPILAVSANVRPDTARLRAAGIDGFLAKPFTPAELRARVRSHLRGPAHGTPAAGSAEGPISGPATDLAAVPDPAAPFDESFLAAQVAYAGPDAVRAAIAVFLDGLEDRLSRFRLAADGRARAEIAHALAGAAGALGLLELAALCRRLADRPGDERGRKSGGPGSRPDPDGLAPEELERAARRGAAALARMGDALAAGAGEGSGDGGAA